MKCSSINDLNRFQIHNVCLAVTIVITHTGPKTVAMQLQKKVFGFLNER